MSISQPKMILRTNEKYKQKKYGNVFKPYTLQNGIILAEALVPFWDFQSLRFVKKNYKK